MLVRLAHLLYSVGAFCFGRPRMSVISLSVPRQISETTRDRREISPPLSEIRVADKGVATGWTGWTCPPHCCQALPPDSLTRGSALNPAGALPPDLVIGSRSALVMVRAPPLFSRSYTPMTDGGDSGFGEKMFNQHTHTHTQPFYGSVEFVRDNPGEPVPEETNTYVHNVRLN